MALSRRATRGQGIYRARHRLKRPMISPSDVRFDGRDGTIHREPFLYGCIDNFLPPEPYRQLVDNFPARERFKFQGDAKHNCTNDHLIGDEPNTVFVDLSR